MDLVSLFSEESIGSRLGYVSRLILLRRILVASAELSRIIHFMVGSSVYRLRWTW
jgi:hypothetical protein